MTFTPGVPGAPRNAETLRQDANAKRERLQAEAAARKLRHDAHRPGRLRRLFRRGAQQDQ